MARNFLVLERNITFSEQQLAFVELRKSYEDLKLELLAEIEVDLERALEDFAGLPVRLASAVAKSLARVSELSVRNLCENGVYDVDETDFQERLVTAASKEQILAPIVAVGLTDEEIEKIQGSGGLGVVGGGFGVEGALQGMAVAGVVNLLTGALSEAAAAGRRDLARQAASRDLRNPENLAKLVGTFERLVDCGLMLAAQVIAVRDPRRLDYPSDEDAKQARALLSNLSKGRVPDGRREDVIVQALEKNPYDPAGHVLLQGAFDSPGESEALADFLGIDVREHAGRSQTKAAIGESSASLSYWVDDMLEIFGRFASKDLHVHPYLPERKISGARREYFKEETLTPPGMSEFQLHDPGMPVALIDTSIFGGGGTGITFGTSGFAWRVDFQEAHGLTWQALRMIEHDISRTIFGVRLFGSDIQLSGISVSKQQLLDIVQALRDRLESRNWVV